MDNKLYKRPSMVVTCFVCGVNFMKEVCEVERAVRNGYSHCCSMSCKAKIARVRQYGSAIGFGFYCTVCKQRAAKRGLEFNLTANYLKELWDSQSGRCKITNVELVMNRGSATMNDKSIYYASVDRIDSSSGYVVGNVQFIALGINYMKNTFKNDDVIQFLNCIKYGDSQLTEVHTLEKC